MRPVPLDATSRVADLGRRTMGGVGWMALSGAGQAVLNVGLLAILARLVTPREFGVVSAAVVVLAFTTIFAEAGIGPALVQRPRITERHVRVGFTFQVVAGVVLWAVLWGAADLVAALFRIGQVATVVPALTSVLVIRSLTLGEFLLLRALDFRRLAILELASWGLGNGVLAVVLALRGYGIWAIVAGQVAQAVLRTLMLWRVSPHAVRPLWDRSILRQLLFFGGGYTLGWWANFLARQGDNVVVGRWLGADALGLYTRAYSLMRQPASLFGSVVNRVLFPAMAAVQQDQRRLRRTYLRSVALVALLVLPASAVAALTAEELVVLLLGERWLGLREAFSVMVFGMLFRTSSKLGDSLASATGHVYPRAWRQGVYAALVVGGALVGARAGIDGVAWGILAALAGNFLLMAQLSLRLTGGRWRAFAAAHVPGLVLAGAVAVPVHLVTRALTSLGTHPAVVLGAGLAMATGVGVLGLRIAPRSRRGRRLARSLSPVLRLLEARSRLRRPVTTILGTWYLEPNRRVAPEPQP